MIMKIHASKENNLKLLVKAPVVCSPDHPGLDYGGLVQQALKSRERH